MEECKIIEYTEEWRDKLRVYMLKTFPNYSKAYIEYCLDRSTDNLPSKIVLNKRERIVGCHLYYCTKVLLNGKEQNTQWGHDTFLDESYRKEIGLDFMLQTQTGKGYGLGLTNINKRLQKKLKKVFFNGVFTYYTITPKLLLSLIQKSIHHTPKLRIKESIKAKGFTFFRVLKPEDITIPNGGYWFKGYRDIDFVRDCFFLRYRFFENQVFDYYVFACKTDFDSGYFVARETLYRGCPALTISDFRYSGNNKSMAKAIIEAAKKLASRSNIGVVLFVSGDVNIDESMKGSIYFKKPMDFISGAKVNPSMSFCVTGADSDADFIK